MTKSLSISNKSVFILVIAGMIFPLVLQAQDNTLEAGLSGGYSYYNGDLVPGAPFVMPKPAFGGVVRYNFGDRWTAKITIIHTKITGDTTKSKPAVQGLNNFNSTINDLSVMGEFNFMKYSTGSKKYKFSPYITAGIGFFSFSTDTINNNVPGNLKSNNFAAIFGLGFKYSLSKRFGLSAEWCMHKTFTDKLDGQIGNSGTKDWFSIADVSVTYKIEFNKKKGCKDLQW